MRGILSRAPRPLKTIGHRVIRPLALAYRVVLLPRVVFIGVTGSTGKTTTKELIAAALSTRFSGSKNQGNSNTNVHLSILRVRPWYKFHVQEIAAAVGGERIPLERPLSLVRPRIGVVTNIGTDHLKAFGSMDAIAGEKGKLIANLPQSGTAILNADDPRVLAMQARCCCRVITCGLSQHAMIRAEHVRCVWPERLSFDVLHDSQRLAVQTQLCGTHWLVSTLAALGAALAMGIPLADAIRAIETVMPVQGRMQPVIRPDGITFICDDVKAPLWSIPATLEFMRSANASRKVVVIGTISDYTGNSTTRYNTVAKQCLDIADLVIFVGPKSSKCAKAKNHPRGDALLAFPSVEAACKDLEAVLQPGDLVLLKGGHQDRLGELCSVELGGGQPPRSGELEASPLDAMQPQTPRAPDTTVSASMEDEANERRGRQPARIVVGFGNPEAAYRDTPHNVGHRVLDRLAHSLGGKWERRPEALVATVEWRGTSLHLVKPMTHVNNSGPVLLTLCQETGLGPADCLLVQDDMDLPLGITRVRQRGGSDGGHRGVRSVLQALGTDRLARIKIGVGRPEQKTEASRHVLRPFSQEDLVAIDVACVKAADSVLGQFHLERLNPPRPLRAQTSPRRSNGILTSVLVPGRAEQSVLGKTERERTSRLLGSGAKRR